MDNINEINNDELIQEERIMAFLQGKMSSDEESAFIDDLKKDEDFKAKAISIARLAKGLDQVGRERDKILKEALLSVDEDTIKNIAKKATSKEKHFAIKSKYATLLSMAASIAVIVYLGFLYSDYQKTTALGEQYAIAFDISPIRGEEETDVQKEIKTLVNNVYNDVDLSKTLKRLTVLWEVSTLSTYNDYTNYASDIGWALATGYLKDNNKKDSKIVLEKLIEITEEGSAINDKAKELLEKL